MPAANDVCVPDGYPCYTAGDMFRRENFASSDWPPGLWGRFGKTRDCRG